MTAPSWSLFSVPVPWIYSVSYFHMILMQYWWSMPPSSSDGSKHLRNLQGLNYPVYYSSESIHFTLSLLSVWPQAHSHLLIGLAQPFWYFISSRAGTRCFAQTWPPPFHFSAKGDERPGSPSVTRAGPKLCSLRCQVASAEQNLSSTMMSRKWFG